MFHVLSIKQFLIPAAECAAGHFSYDGHEPCRPCPRGYYQHQSGQTDCIACSSRKTTAQEGSTRSDRCIETGACMREFLRSFVRLFVRACGVCVLSHKRLCINNVFGLFTHNSNCVCPGLLKR